MYDSQYQLTDGIGGLWRKTEADRRLSQKVGDVGAIGTVDPRRRLRMGGEAVAISLLKRGTATKIAAAKGNRSI